MREKIIHAGLQRKAILYGNNRYIDGRDNVKILGIAEKWYIYIYIYIYIFIYIYIYFIQLTYLYSYSICCWIHIRDWIYRSCIVIQMSLVLDGSLHYVQCVPYAKIVQIFLLFSMIWNCRIQSPAVSKQRDVRLCGFRYSIPMSIGYLWKLCIDMAISTPSCSHCIWNRYWQNHRSILPNLPLFAWFDTPESNRLPWSNN